MSKHPTDPKLELASLRAEYWRKKALGELTEQQDYEYHGQMCVLDHGIDCVCWECAYYVWGWGRSRNP